MTTGLDTREGARRYADCERIHFLELWMFAVAYRAYSESRRRQREERENRLPPKLHSPIHYASLYIVDFLGGIMHRLAASARQLRECHQY